LSATGTDAYHPPEAPPPPNRPPPPEKPPEELLLDELLEPLLEYVVPPEDPAPDVITATISWNQALQNPSPARIRARIAAERTRRIAKHTMATHVGHLKNRCCAM
jgi:hypothetical protein